MKFGLDDSVIMRIQNILRKYPQIEKAVLYGSRAKGNYKNGSDIDLTLCGNGLDLNLMNKISLELDDLLMPYMLDLSIYENISNEILIEHIKRVGKIFYSK